MKDGLMLSNRKSIQLRRLELGSMLIYQKGRDQFQQNESVSINIISINIHVIANQCPFPRLDTN
jgi:hypothetical protein